ncbi:MAG: hypothetical protein KGR26_15725, partial [Cyanobacteria bacterium REEB65]|nr:hypothetical protein [Cyanobacteria bacterium REEB65]
AQASDSFQQALTFPEVKADAQAIQNLSQVVALSAQGPQQAINSDIAFAASAIDGVGDSLNALVDATLSPEDTARRTIALLQTIQSNMDDVQTNLESQVDRQFFAPAPAGLPGSGGLLAQVGSVSSMTVGQAVKASLAVRGLKDGARDLQHDAAESNQLLASQVQQPELIQAFIARAGQDLRFVSASFYGTPDEWLSLMVFNNLTSSLLSQGQVVYVPTQRAD